MKRFSLTTVIVRMASTLVLLIACSTTVIPSASADDSSMLRMTRTIKINDIGNADIRLTIKAPTNLYTQLKTKTPNTAVLLRKLGAGRHWAMLENVDGKFDDMDSSIQINYVQRGVARVESGANWVLQFEKGSSLDVVDVHENTAIYNTAMNSELGLVNLIVKVVAPEGSKNFKCNKTENTCSYQFVPALSQGTESTAKFGVDCKETLMSCLAKCYSNEQFTQIWAARSRFENTGNTVLSDYRVRFRIAGLSAWSGWNRSEKVYPGQIVIDPFFPVFDLDKVNALTGSRPEALEIEYQYRRADGQMVTESDSQKVMVLGRNEVFYNGLANTEILSFQDAHEYDPAILASFTTPNDPVIQQLAGRISGRANGAAASYNDNDAEAFLRAMWDFLGQNKVAYQSPEHYAHGSKNGQHIKYGRDVLHNHAGTCIDLAILWASTCEAVGLHPILVTIPGHCFPAVRMPSGKIIAIEATAMGKVTFEKATEIGAKEYNEAQQGAAIFTDVMQMRNNGVQCLDLPAVPHTYLTELGYVFEAPASPKKEEAPQNNQQNAAKQNNTNPAPNNAPVQQQNANQQVKNQNQVQNNNANPGLAGTWEFNGQINGQNIGIGLALLADGRMGCCIKYQLANGYRGEMTSSGRWGREGNCLILTDQSGTTRVPFAFQNGRLNVTLTQINTTIPLSRIDLSQGVAMK
jgi:hypothetical protein